MRQYRLSASLLLVAVLAADLAVARRAFQGGGPAAGEVRELASLFGPMTLALQFGLWRALGGRREARPFWTGFLAGGLLVVGWFGVAILTRAPALLAPLNAYETLPRALLYDILLGGSAAARRYLLARPSLRLAYVSAYFFALQLALAVATGLAWRFIARPRVR
jgi:hypothetical protein